MHSFKHNTTTWQTEGQKPQNQYRASIYWHNLVNAVRRSPLCSEIFQWHVISDPAKVQQYTNLSLSLITDCPFYPLIMTYHEHFGIQKFSHHRTHHNLFHLQLIGRYLILLLLNWPYFFMVTVGCISIRSGPPTGPLWIARVSPLDAELSKHWTHAVLTIVLISPFVHHRHHAYVVSVFLAGQSVVQILQQSAATKQSQLYRNKLENEWHITWRWYEPNIIRSFLQCELNILYTSSSNVKHAWATTSCALPSQEYNAEQSATQLVGA